MHLDKRAKKLLEKPIAEGPLDELLDTPAVADWFDCTEGKIEIDRHKGRGPKPTRMANGRIKYRRRDILKFLNERARQWTAEYMRRVATRRRPPRLSR
jgi:hypothetical protein